MRVGDFGVEVVPVNEGEVVRELASGHVLARPGTVYKLRLRNYGPNRCVTQISIDGTSVTASQLVLEAYSATFLERPVHATESGRFTVIAEGDERAFGPDGGRDNPNLGLIEAGFRRELPDVMQWVGVTRSIPDKDTPRHPSLPEPSPRIPAPPGRPMAPPEWTPMSAMPRAPRRADISASHLSRVEVERQAPPAVDDMVERAAGTGLTGHSTQEFVPVTVGPLEDFTWMVRLRIVVGTEEALAAPRPLPNEETAPARPAPRP